MDLSRLDELYELVSNFNPFESEQYWRSLALGLNYYELEVEAPFNLKELGILSIILMIYADTRRVYLKELHVNSKLLFWNEVPANLDYLLQFYIYIDEINNNLDSANLIKLLSISDSVRLGIYYRSAVDILVPKVVSFKIATNWRCDTLCYNLERIANVKFKSINLILNVPSCFDIINLKKLLDLCLKIALKVKVQLLVYTVGGIQEDYKKFLSSKILELVEDVTHLQIEVLRSDIY